jgi:hypothetical protein
MAATPLRSSTGRERGGDILDYRGGTGMSNKTGGAKGSAMSSKQLARTVLDGRRLIFRLTSGVEVEGYLSGMDDFHWMVVTTEGQKFLLHKGSTALIALGDESTYKSEPLHYEMEKIIRPFREFISREFYGREVAPSASGERVAS